MKVQFTLPLLLAAAFSATAGPLIEFSLTCSAGNSVSHHVPSCLAGAGAAQASADARSEEYVAPNYMYSARAIASASAFASGYLSAYAESTATLTRWL
jgi:hypothetical protein